MEGSDCYQDSGMSEFSYEAEDGPETRIRVPTRRPLSRPQSARMNRHHHAMEYRSAVRRIMADQKASVQDARFLKELAIAETQDMLRQENIAKACHTQEFKENERRCMAQRSARYYAAERRRTQEVEAKATSQYRSFVDMKAEQAERREFNVDMNKQQLRRTEQMCSVSEQRRAAQHHRGACRQRVEVLGALQEQLHEAHLRKTEKIHSFREAEELRLESQRIAELSKEMQRKQDRIWKLRSEKLTWRAACEHRETTSQELLLRDKIKQEQHELAGLRSEISACQAEHVSRRRPKSASLPQSRGACPIVSGISGFSTTTRSSRDEALHRQAAKCGPVVSVVDPRVAVASVG